MEIGDIARNAFMLAATDGYPTDHVFWSLVHELRLSLLIPAIAAAILRFGAVPSLVAALAFSSFAEALAIVQPGMFHPQYAGFLFDDPSFISSVTITARFVFAFTVGAALALGHARFVEAIPPNRLVVAALGIAGLALLSIANDLLMTAGAASLVLAVTLTGGPGPAALHRIGRNSFSLYLVHLPTMLVIGLLLDAIASPRLSLICAIVLSVLLAEIMFLTVERPSILIGRKISARVSTGFRSASWRDKSPDLDPCER